MRGLLLTLLIAALPCSAVRAQEDTTIWLSVGTSKVLEIPGTQRVAVGDPSIVDVTVVGTGEVVLVGRGEGRTTLLVWHSNGSRLSYLVTVRRDGPSELMEELRTLLGDREGISLRQVGDRCFFEGSAFDLADYDRVQEITAIYRDRVVNLLKLAPNAAKLMAVRINTALAQAGMKDVRATALGGRIALEGTVSSAEERERAGKIADAIWATR